MRESGSPRSSDLVAIAKIRRPVGLKGVCVVTAFGETLGRARPPLDVYVGREDGGTAKATVVEMRSDHKGWYCRFDGYDTRESAESLRDYLVLIDQRQLPKPRRGTYYHFELEGMTVVSVDGEEIGRVKEVHSFPTTDAIEVDRPGKGAALIPLGTGIVQSMDTAARRMVIRTDGLDEVLD
jgi:16S rRNA processing protein RimM